MSLLLIALLGLAMTYDIYEQPEDAEPVTLSPSVVTDTWGDPRFTDVDDPAQEVWQGPGAGPALQTVFSAGLVNADFLAGPRDPNLHIDDSNPLPGWSYVVVQGGGITADWVDETTAPSGKAIRWTIANAVANDEVYLEQTIAVSPRQRLKIPILRSTVGGDADSLPEVRIQYLLRDGTTTGTEQVGVLDPAFLDPQDVYALAGIPGDARFARIRIVMTTGGAVTSDTVDFHEAWAGEPRISYETWTFSDVTSTGTGTNTIYAVAGNNEGDLQTTAQMHITPDAGQGTIGWVEAIAVRLDQARSAGTSTYQLEAASAGVLGPIATIDGTNTKMAWVTANLVDSSDLLVPGDRYTIRQTGAGFTPTTADAFVTVRLAFVQLTTTTGGGTS